MFLNTNFLTVRSFSHLRSKHRFDQVATMGAGTTVIKYVCMSLRYLVLKNKDVLFLTTHLFMNTALEPLDQVKLIIRKTITVVRMNNR